MSRVGVTGASGYLGRALLARLHADGHAVVAIGRRAVAGAEEFRAADLRAPVPAGLCTGLDAVVHLAVETGAGDVTPAQEIAFAHGLVDEATRAACRLVFVSSQAASPDAPTAYGRTKAAIEARVLAAGGVNVRPGMVYGGASLGLFGRLANALEKLPAIPALAWPTPRVSPVHVDDVAAALSRLVDAPAGTPGCIALGGEPMPFHRFLDAIARHRLGRRLPVVPVPVPLLRAALALVPGRAGFSGERLDSLLALPDLDAGSAVALGVALRPLATGLRDPAPTRRALLREGARLSRALLGAPAPRTLWRRYARALPALGVAWPLAMSPWLGPARLAALDAPARRATSQPGDLAWRFAVVARLAEVEPALADRFLAPRLGLARAVAGLVVAGLLEVRSRLLAPFGGVDR